MLVLSCFFFFSSRRRHTRSKRDWSSDVCSSDLAAVARRHGGSLYRSAGWFVGTRAVFTTSAPYDFAAGRSALDRPEALHRRCEIGRASCRERGGDAGGEWSVKKNIESNVGYRR